jgi:hypothetical protein
MGEQSFWERTLVVPASIGLLAVWTGVDLASEGTNPWPWVVAVAVSVAVLAGPIRWRLQEQLTENKRVKFRVLTGLPVAVPMAVWALLLAGSFTYRLDIFVCGGLVGFGVVEFSERTDLLEH